MKGFDFDNQPEQMIIGGRRFKRDGFGYYKYENERLHLRLELALSYDGKLRRSAWVHTRPDSTHVMWTLRHVGSTTSSSVSNYALFRTAESKARQVVKELVKQEKQALARMGSHIQQLEREITVLTDELNVRKPKRPEPPKKASKARKKTG